MQPESSTPKPTFQWISGGVILAALACWWFIWVYQMPDKAGEKPIELQSLLIGLGVIVAAAVGWQYLRWRVFKEDVAKGLLTTGSGPPSHLWAVIKGLLAGPTVYTGSRGGKYTVDHKGNKKYKHRG